MGNFLNPKPMMLQYAVSRRYGTATSKVTKYTIDMLVSFNSELSKLMNAEIIVHCKNGCFGPVYFSGLESKKTHRQECVLQDMGSVQHIELCMRKRGVPNECSSVSILSIIAKSAGCNASTTTTFSVDGELHMHDVDSLSVMLHPKTFTKDSEPYDPHIPVKVEGGDVYGSEEVV